jgi:hypothetical protein
MQGETHRSLSLELAKVAFYSPAFPAFANRRTLIEEIGEYASLPDEVQDIAAGRFGTKIAGHNLSAMTHFCVPTDQSGHFRGYCWHSDRSLCHSLRKFDPRVGDVRVQTDPWMPIVGRAIAEKHPLRVLIADLQGKATLDVDNFTFPTAAIMAEWVWKIVTSLNGYPSAKAVACICHWIQDACVPHHAHGWLTNGHTGTERRIRDEWKRIAPDADQFLGEFIAPGYSPTPRNPRTIVEHAATATCLKGKKADHPRGILRSAAYWTFVFLRGTVRPMLDR